MSRSNFAKHFIKEYGENAAYLVQQDETGKFIDKNAETSYSKIWLPATLHVHFEKEDWAFLVRLMIRNAGVELLTYNDLKLIDGLTDIDEKIKNREIIEVELDGLYYPSFQFFGTEKTKSRVKEIIKSFDDNVSMLKIMSLFFEQVNSEYYYNVLDDDVIFQDILELIK